MTYQNLLVGTDGSPAANLALRRAALLAKAFDATLLVIFAYERNPEGSEEGWPEAGSAIAEEIVTKAKRLAAELGANAEARSEEGHAAEVILDTAAKESVDLIVVGNVGMTGGKRFLLGSIPDRVSHHSPCDLLIVRTSDTTDDNDVVYRKILIGTDGSPTADRAVARGYELARAIGARVLLLYVGDKEHGMQILNETRERHDSKVETFTLVAEGDPADQICDVAENQKADLILLGNRGMAGPRRFLLGGVPNQITHYAPTDVLVVKTV